MTDFKNITKLFDSLHHAASEEEVTCILGEFFHKNFTIKFFANTLYDEGSFSSYIEKLSYNFEKYDGIFDNKLIENNEQTIYPISQKEHSFSFLEIDSILSRLEKDLIELTLPILAIKLENINLSSLVRKNIEFQKAIKNIAKIIETQYEQNFIIPIIGEILDKFIENHLVYIFLKQENEYKLVWPNSCLDKNIIENVASITPESEVLINNSRKTAFFPIKSDKELLGCVVTKSTEGAISKQEFSNLQQLVNQTAITISRANLYAEILQYATLDALTGFYNRRQLDERVKQEFSEAKRKKTPLCAIMTDIDFFKRVNDNYGHAAGDLILKTVSKIMRSQLREYDIAGRYGGEEFVILMPETTLEETLIVANRLKSAIENTVINIEKVNTKNDTKEISVTISLGIYCHLPETPDNCEDLLLKADKALYSAKENGRNQIVVYTEQI